VSIKGGRGRSGQRAPSSMRRLPVRTLLLLLLLQGVECAADGKQPGTEEWRDTAVTAQAHTHLQQVGDRDDICMLVRPALVAPVIWRVVGDGLV
jgi:hypothetical protein